MSCFRRQLCVFIFSRLLSPSTLYTVNTTSEPGTLRASENRHDSTGLDCGCFLVRVWSFYDGSDGYATCMLVCDFLFCTVA